MANALIDSLSKDSEEMKFYLQEKSILEITEIIAQLMENKNVKKIELAKRLNRSKGYITQLLNGRANMTLRTISDVLWALDFSLTIEALPLEFEKDLESVGQYDLSRGADFWEQQTIRLNRTQRPDVTDKEKEAVEQLKLAG